MTHFILSHLASDCEREFIHKSDIARDFIVCNLAMTVCEKLLMLSSAWLLELNPGADLLPEEVIIHTNDLCISYIGVLH